MWNNSEEKKQLNQLADLLCNTLRYELAGENVASASRVIL